MTPEERAEKAKVWDPRSPLDRLLSLDTQEQRAFIAFFHGAGRYGAGFSRLFSRSSWIVRVASRWANPSDIVLAWLAAETEAEADACCA